MDMVLNNLLNKNSVFIIIKLIQYKINLAYVFCKSFPELQI